MAKRGRSPCPDTEILEDSDATVPGGVGLEQSLEEVMPDTIGSSPIPALEHSDDEVDVPNGANVQQALEDDPIESDSESFHEDPERDTLLRTLKALNDMQQETENMGTVVSSWMLALQDSEWAKALLLDLENFNVSCISLSSSVAAAKEMEMPEYHNLGDGDDSVPSAELSGGGASAGGDAALTFHRRHDLSHEH